MERFDADEFYLHLTEAEAESGSSGTRIDLTSDPSGTHTFTAVYVLPTGTNTVVGQKEDQVNNQMYYFVHNSNDRHVILRYDPKENVARLVLENNAWARGYYWWNTLVQSSDWASGTTYAMTEVVVHNDSYYMSLQEGNVGVDPEGADTLVPHSSVTSSTAPLYAELYWKKLDDYFPIDSATSLITHIEVINRDGDTFLLWTDGSNEPSMINVSRCMSSSKATQYPPMAPDNVALYASTPQWAPKIGYVDDPDIDTNSVREKIFQFRYRYKYRNGEYSAYSPISRIALPTRNYENQILNIDGKINVRVYLPDNLTNSASYSWVSEVDEVEVAFRQNGDNNTGNWYVAQTLTVSDETVLDGTRANQITAVAFSTTEELTIAC